MKRSIYFGEHDGNSWPPVDKLAPYFLLCEGRNWPFDGGNDNWGIEVTDASDIDAATGASVRFDINLSMWGHPEHGVLLFYEKVGTTTSEAYFSRGDMSRIGEWVRTLHGDLRPIGLYIPFTKAWLAVKEFMETDGQLPKSIEWVRAEDLPPNTFPDPWEHPEVK